MHIGKQAELHLKNDFFSTNKIIFDMMGLR